MNKFSLRFNNIGKQAGNKKGEKDLFSIRFYLLFSFLSILTLLIISIVPSSAQTSYQPPQTISDEELAIRLGMEGIRETWDIDLKVYKDPDSDLSNYKTYKFDYKSQENPLLEKELFKSLEKFLNGKGLKLDDEDPALIIALKFSSEQKERNAPQILKSQKAAIYYHKINLYFYDAAKLKGGQRPEVPPIVWQAEIENEGKISDIRSVAPIMFNEAFLLFPEKNGKEGWRRVYLGHLTCGIIGVKFDAYDLRIIREVLPGSPAEKAGLKPNDMIVEINGKRCKKEDFTLGRSRLDNPHFKEILLENGLGNAFRPIDDPYYPILGFNYEHWKHVTLKVKNLDTGTTRKVEVIPDILDRDRIFRQFR